LKHVNGLKEDTPQLDGLFVAPEMRRKGYARQLLQKAMAEHPGLILASNVEGGETLPGALGLYESEGFVPIAKDNSTLWGQQSYWNKGKMKTAAKLQRGPGVVYHASPELVETIEPRDTHGDPDVAKAVFATPHLQMALAYAGKKWGDRDIDQSWLNPASRWALREMRPGAFDDIYGPGQVGYLYELPADKFRQPDRSLGSDYEVISNQAVKPLKVHMITNIQQRLRDAGVELHPYDPKHKGFAAAVGRTAQRATKMSLPAFEEYMSWVSETNPELAAAIRNQVKASTKKLAATLRTQVKASTEQLGGQHRTAQKVAGVLSTVGRFVARNPWLQYVPLTAGGAISGGAIGAMSGGLDAGIAGGLAGAGIGAVASHLGPARVVGNARKQLGELEASPALSEQEQRNLAVLQQRRAGGEL
jgi:hypothetical protein